MQGRYKDTSRSAMSSVCYPPAPLDSSGSIPISLTEVRKDSVSSGIQQVRAISMQQDSGFLDGAASSQAMDSRATSTASSFLSKTSVDGSDTAVVVQAAEKNLAHPPVFSLGACYRAVLRGGLKPCLSHNSFPYDRSSWRQNNADNSKCPHRARSSPGVQWIQVKTGQSLAVAGSSARSLPVPDRLTTTTARSSDVALGSHITPRTQERLYRPAVCESVHSGRKEHNIEEVRHGGGDVGVSCHSRHVTMPALSPTVSSTLTGVRSASSLLFWLPCCCVSNPEDISEFPQNRLEDNAQTQAPQSSQPSNMDDNGQWLGANAGTVSFSSSALRKDGKAGQSSPSSESARQSNMFFIGANPNGDDSDESEAVLTLVLGKRCERQSLLVDHNKFIKADNRKDVTIDHSRDLLVNWEGVMGDLDKGLDANDSNGVMDYHSKGIISDISSGVMDDLGNGVIAKSNGIICLHSKDASADNSNDVICDQSEGMRADSSKDVRSDHSKVTRADSRKDMSDHSKVLRTDKSEDVMNDHSKVTMTCNNSKDVMGDHSKSIRGDNKNVRDEHSEGVRNENGKCMMGDHSKGVSDENHDMEDHSKGTHGDRSKDVSDHSKDAKADNSMVMSDHNKDGGDDSKEYTVDDLGKDTTTENSMSTDVMTVDTKGTKTSYGEDRETGTVLDVSSKYMTTDPCKNQKDNCNRGLFSDQSKDKIKSSRLRYYR